MWKREHFTGNFILAKSSSLTLWEVYCSNYRGCPCLDDKAPWLSGKQLKAPPLFVGDSVNFWRALGISLFRVDYPVQPVIQRTSQHVSHCKIWDTPTLHATIKIKINTSKLLVLSYLQTPCSCESGLSMEKFTRCKKAGINLQKTVSTSSSCKVTKNTTHY